MCVIYMMSEETKAIKDHGRLILYRRDEKVANQPIRHILYCTQGCGHAERRDGVKNRQDRVQMKTLSETMNPFSWTDSAARNCHCI